LIEPISREIINPKDVDAVMNGMFPSWRYRWCESEVCACMGCANRAGKVHFSKEEWESWVKENPEEKNS
jgi:hypothetical protein